MQRITQAVLQRFTKAQSVNGARAVLIDFCRRRFPAGEAAFAEAFDDLTQPCQDCITLKITGAAALI
ncbi:hypothetical protein D3C80_1801550 [compost metagenome]